MRVLIIPSWYSDVEKPLNGIFFKEQADALQKEGIDVTILYISLASINSIMGVKYTKGIECSMEDGLKVYRYRGINFFPRMTRLYVKYYSRLLKKYIKQIEGSNGEFDLVHIHSAFDAGMAYSQLKGTPYVITEHSSRYHRNVINSSEKELLKDVFHRASRVIAVGKGLGEKISPYCNKDIEIIPNMVKIYDEEVVDDLTKEKFRFFSLANLNSYKGMDLLLEAFSKKIDTFKQCELYIGGTGAELENLQNLCQRLEISQYVKFLGALNRKEVQFHMHNCDCFVLASRIETFGVVFIEAMAHGKPVIGTKTGGPDTFINDKVGKIVEINDIDGLSRAMFDVYKEQELYNKDYIKSYCKNNFSEKVIASKIIEIYNGVKNN